MNSPHRKCGNKYDYLEDWLPRYEPDDWMFSDYSSFRCSEFSISGDYYY